MTANSGISPRAPWPARLYRLYFTAFAIAVVGNLAIRASERGAWLGEGLRLAVALATAAPLFLAAALFWRLLRGELDEMLQRIVLEGLAFAVIVFVPLAALYGNVDAATHGLPRLQFVDLLMLPGLLVALGIELARRRYA